MQSGARLKMRLKFGAINLNLKKPSTVYINVICNE